MYLLRGVKTLTLVKNVICDSRIEICCVAGLCRVVKMPYFLDNDVTSVNPFYFVGCSQPLSPELVFSFSEADVYITVIVLTDVKPHKRSRTKLIISYQFALQTETFWEENSLLFLSCIVSMLT
jgi:hypothetical protein